MAAGRGAALAPLLALAACGGGDAGEAQLPEGATAIECALGGAGDFTAGCAVEPRGEDAREFVIWHPDGGFRRFERLDDGRWLTPADGADGAEVEPVEGTTQVSVAGDRYRLPPAIFDHGGE